MSPRYALIHMILVVLALVLFGVSAWLSPSKEAKLTNAGLCVLALSMVL